MKKELVAIWSQTYVNAPIVRRPYWGLGDMIRGTLFLYRLAKRRGYKLTVDNHLHPLSKFISYSNFENNDFIDKNQEKIWFFEKSFDLKKKIEVIHRVRNVNHKLFCMTNNGNEKMDQLITSDEQEFIKSILKPTLDVQLEIDQLISTLRENYTILNVRFSDETMKKAPSQFRLDEFKRVAKTTDVVISNSLSFKRQMDLPFMDHESGHIGIEQDLEKIKNSFIDFHIMARSKHINTFSQYSWVSGYALWASKIYDVPLTNIKQEIKNLNTLKVATVS